MNDWLRVLVISAALCLAYLYGRYHDPAIFVVEPVRTPATTQPVQAELEP